MPGTRAGSRSRTLAAMAASAVVGAALIGGGAAVADTSAPKSDREIPNLSTVVSQIKAYYGDTVVDGEHYASPDSNYARQVAGIEAKAKADLARELTHKHLGGKPAIVLDVDDTSLLTYNYELEVGFNYTPASNDTYIRTKTMAAVFGMPGLANWAADHGITVFWITGRPESQREPSAANLTAVGYKPTPDAEHFFLKNKTNPPAYLSCGANCTTVQYKSGTRAHIESEGYRILANIGDQQSDLDGGHAVRSYKIPNPMYFVS